jgi:hypothetical protein
MKLAVLNLVKAFVRETLGTIGTLEGYNHCELNGVNVAGEKKVFVDVHFNDGSAERLWCSSAVSTAIRNKSITTANILALPIAKATREDGSEFYQLQMPSSNSVPLVIDSKVKAVEYVRAKSGLTMEQLLATV